MTSLALHWIFRIYYYSILICCNFFLVSCHDLTPWQLFDMLFGLVKKSPERGDLPESIFTNAVACTHYSLLWHLTRLNEHNPDKVGIMAYHPGLTSSWNVYIKHEKRTVQSGWLQVPLLSCYLVLCLSLLIWQRNVNPKCISHLLF